MKLRGGKTIGRALLSVVCLCLLATMTFAAAGKRPDAGQKATVRGTIISRDGDLVKVVDKKDGSTVAVRVTDSTKIECEKGMHAFFTHTDMKVKALVPGLTVKAEGVRNAEGQLEAKKIKFNPDVFAVTVAQQQQIMDNKAAVGRAQSTADQGLDNAATAQSSANKAQSTADQGVAAAQAATDAAAANTVAVQRLTNECRIWATTPPWTRQEFTLPRAAIG
jgi:Domain of unknown function (DUF5666)